MRSLSTKMIAAFVAVSIVTIVLTVMLARGASARTFRNFVEDQVQGSVVEALQGYYARNGSWRGVEQYHVPGQFVRIPGRGAGRFASPGFILVDNNGVVLIGTQTTPPRTVLSTETLADAVPLISNDEQVGSLVLLDSLGAELVPPELLKEFNDQVERAIFLGGASALVLAIMMGALFTRSLTRPVRELTQATRQVAAGTLDEPVPVRSQDELGELAHAFNQMNDSLRESEQKRRQMTADIAHDLRTPLSVILGHAEGVRDGVLPAEDETFFIIYDEAQRLQRLVEELRTLSLADSGELPLMRRPVEPMALLGRAAAAHGPQAQQNNVTLLVEGGDTLPPVNVDADRIAQVLDNLVSNALRYTPAGGRIILSGQRANGNVQLRVQDTGPGIPPQDLPHLFDRFYRADKSRQRHAGGSGLGLAIAKSIVQNHGGRIWAESKLGDGSAFILELPLAQLTAQ